MFEGIKSLWKGIVKMFNYNIWKSIVGKDAALSQQMIDAINGWQNMINGQAYWISGPVKSLKIEQGICREFADSVLVEMDTSIDNEKLDGIYQKCISDLNENLQDGLALGSMIIKPTGPESAEYVTADKFIPIRFGDDGKLLDVGFLSTKRIGETDFYTRFERHYFVNGNLTIENQCYHSQNQSEIGLPCSLESVEEWASINPGPITFPGMVQMDFGYYRNPLKNRVDGSKCGVSIFDSAKELIAKADVQGARLDWEYESGERAIHVDDRALKQNKGKFRMAKLSNRLYRGLNLDDGKDKELLREYSPQMRDEAYIRGIEKYYRDIEFNVGLSYGDLSDVQQVEKTAAEIKIAKLRKYNRVDAIQAKLESCLEDFVAALAFYNNLYTTSYEFACKFNDSILTDDETERQQDRNDVAMGVMSHWEYRMKWYNEDEETAKAHLPEQIGVME